MGEKNGQVWYKHVDSKEGMRGNIGVISGENAIQGQIGTRYHDRVRLRRACTTTVPRVAAAESEPIKRRRLDESGRLESKSNWRVVMAYSSGDQS